MVSDKCQNSIGAAVQRQLETHLNLYIVMELFAGGSKGFSGTKFKIPEFILHSDRENIEKGASEREMFKRIWGGGHMVPNLLIAELGVHCKTCVALICREV